MENSALHKIKLAVLWLVFECGALAIPSLSPLEPGYIEGLIAGEVAGSQITPELIMTHAIAMMILPLMAVLSLILKDSINRWANIIAGIVFAALALIFGPIDYLTRPSAYLTYLIPIGIIQLIVAALVVWYAWKWPKQQA